MYKLIIILIFTLLSTPIYALNNLRTNITITQLESSNAKISKIFVEDYSSQFVLELPNGTVINEGGIITESGEILYDTQTNLNGDQHRLKSIKRDINQENPLFFNGRLAVISSPGSENWYHWLLQVLPRLIILSKSKIEFDRIYINNLKYKWQQLSLNSVLSYLNIPEDKLFIVNNDCIIQATTLIVPSVPFIPDKGNTLPNWMKQELRTIFLSAPTSQQNLATPEKIYISRKLASIRKITNETELTNKLKKMGFKVILLETLEPKEQARIFNNAKIIVTPHGSSLANLIFIKPNCKIIEIDHGTNPPRSYYSQFTKLMEGQYFPFYIDKTTEEHLEDNMKVNLVQFIPLLKHVLNEYN